MTIEDAITHHVWAATASSGQVSEEHKQQAEWLAELVQAREDNAKLRALATRFADYVGQDRCDGCVTKTSCNEGLLDECRLLTEIREIADGLGIEVKE